MKRNHQKIAILIIFLNLFFFLAAPMALMANGDSRGENENDSMREETGEVVGAVAGWLFGLANLTVVFGLAARAVVSPVNPAAPWKETLKRWNRAQKKFLGRFHYLLNPAAVLLAGLHWSLSNCGVVSFQKIGLPLIGLWAALGLTLKFQLAPKKWRPRLFKLHTTWLIPAALFVLVAIGHALTED